MCARTALLALRSVCVFVCATLCACRRVCVCLTHRATGQAADIIHLLVTKRGGCWVGSRQALGAEDGSWILIPSLLSPASHDGKSLTSGLENKAESFSQLAVVNAKHPNTSLKETRWNHAKCVQIYTFCGFCRASLFQNLVSFLSSIISDWFGTFMSISHTTLETQFGIDFN